jgi:hypothetical protein
MERPSRATSRATRKVSMWTVKNTEETGLPCWMDKAISRAGDTWSYA